MPFRVLIFNLYILGNPGSLIVPYPSSSPTPPHVIIHTITHLAFTHLPKQTCSGKAENRLGLDWDYVFTAGSFSIPPFIFFIYLSCLSFLLTLLFLLYKAEVEDISLMIFMMHSPMFKEFRIKSYKRNYL